MQDHRKDKIANSEDKQRTLEYFKDSSSENKIHFVFIGRTFEQIKFVNPILDDDCPDEAENSQRSEIRVKGTSIYLEDIVGVSIC